MEIIPIKTGLLKIKPFSQLMHLIKGKIKNGDILVMTSKIIALEQGRMVKLSTVKASKKAKKLAKEFSLKPEIAELIIQEADKILGGVKKAVLTFKNGILIANAGIDESNVPKGYAILWPKNPEKEAEKIRKKINKRIGVVIIDSTCAPLRKGTRGLALAIAGFFGIIDERGKKDLFGKKMRITTRNIADQIAAAASLVMGERNERIPVVIMRGLKVKFTDQTAKKLTKELLMERKKDLFKDILKF